MAEIKKDRQQTLKHGVHGLPLKFHFVSIQPSTPLNPWHFHVNKLFIYIVKGTLLDCFTLKSNESHNEPILAPLIKPVLFTFRFTPMWNATFTRGDSDICVPWFSHRNIKKDSGITPSLPTTELFKTSDTGRFPSELITKESAGATGPLKLFHCGRCTH